MVAENTKDKIENPRPYRYKLKNGEPLPETKKEFMEKLAFDESSKIVISYLNSDKGKRIETESDRGYENFREYSKSKNFENLGEVVIFGRARYYWFDNETLPENYEAFVFKFMDLYEKGQNFDLNTPQYEKITAGKSVYRRLFIQKEYDVMRKMLPKLEAGTTIKIFIFENLPPEKAQPRNVNLPSGAMFADRGGIVADGGSVVTTGNAKVTEIINGDKVKGDKFKGDKHVFTFDGNKRKEEFFSPHDRFGGEKYDEDKVEDKTDTYEDTVYSSGGGFGGRNKQW